MSSEQLQLAYMPYISMATEDEIEIGKVKIWNYSRKADDYIKDINLRRHIDRIISLNVYNDKPITNIGIISIGKIDFREFNEAELIEIKEASILLFLSVLSYQMRYKGDNSGFFLRTTENFRYIIRNIKPGDEHIAENSGMIVNKLDINLISKIQFNMPTHIVLNELRFDYDKTLIEGLIRLKNRTKQLYNRIIRAVEIFSQSYFNSDDINLMLRMLFQITSFEILLDLGSYPRKEFKDKVEKYTVVPSDRRYVHFYDNHRQDANRTMKGKWADIFYKLRNNIVHGDTIRRTQYKFRAKEYHFHIATMFFVVIIKKLIDENRSRKLFNEDIIWNSKEQVFEHEDRSILLMIKRGIRKEINKAKKRYRKQTKRNN
jgi:hypothetical protein